MDTAEPRTRDRWASASWCSSPATGVACLLVLPFEQRLAVLGERAPVFHLFEGLGEIGAKLFPLGSALEQDCVPWRSRSSWATLGPPLVYRRRV